MDQLFNVPTRAECCTECDVYAPVSSNLLVQSSAFYQHVLQVYWVRSCGGGGGGGGGGVSFHT